MVTLIRTVAPTSAGFGVIVAAVILGADVSRVTVRVIVDALPTASVAVTTIVLLPSLRVTALLKAPLDATVTVP